MHRRTQQQHHVVNSNRLKVAGAASTAGTSAHGMKSIPNAKDSESGCDEKQDKEAGDGDTRCMRSIDIICCVGNKRT